MQGQLAEALAELARARPELLDARGQAAALQRSLGSAEAQVGTRDCRGSDPLQGRSPSCVTYPRLFVPVQVASLRGEVTAAEAVAETLRARLAAADQRLSAADADAAASQSAASIEEGTLRAQNRELASLLQVRMLLTLAPSRCSSYLVLRSVIADSARRSGFAAAGDTHDEQ